MVSDYYLSLVPTNLHETYNLDFDFRKKKLMTLNYVSPYTTMGLLTWKVPSSQTREADSISGLTFPSIMTENDFFCPIDVKDRTFGFTWISIKDGDTTLAL